ncbi:T9SS type A sorting domain-containing protein [candidate division KSB1 bacterium]|nr:T9SS type A sorting domain-containing protein [bacterium]NUM64169.1 T9SS type A sorting domain-containing protein [candidate division KSB1 bacterium]
MRVHARGLGWMAFSPAYCVSAGLLVLLLLLGGQSAGRAQQFERVVTLPVEVSGQPLEFPFLGGLDFFIPQFVDIDADRDFDLFYFTPTEKRLLFLENIGDAQVRRFRLANDRYGDFEIRSWFCLVDIDADGDFDFYQDNNQGGLAFYRNIGSAQVARFTLETEAVTQVSGEEVRIDYTSAPAFADIDADGDYDFFSGNILGYIEFYQNVGNPASPVFQFETSTWQNLRIISGGAVAPARGLAASRHGANGIDFVDFDGDADRDLFYGDFFHPGVYFLRNQGTPASARIVIADSAFPAGRPVHTLGYNIPRFADIDGNGAVDFFVACQNQNLNNFIFYQNTGTATLPQLKIAANNFLTQIDVGSNSAPALADLDRDGDLDLFLGDLNGRLHLFENTGSASAPAFRWVTDNFQNIKLNAVSAPAFADLDGDADLDLVIGTVTGSDLVLFENIGTPQVPNFVLADPNFQNIDLGSYSSPCFADADFDGDLDLFLGEYAGAAVAIFENTGNARQPVMQFRKKLRPPLVRDYAAPCLHDVNRDGFLDLLVGTLEGEMLHFQGTAALDSFVLVDARFAGLGIGAYSKPVLADLNGDGAVDLLVGEGDGGLNYFQGTAANDVTQPARLPEGFELQTHPNPFSGSVQISLRAPGGRGESPRVMLFNLMGARIAEMAMQTVAPGQWVIDWSPAALDLAPGVYFVMVKMKGIQLVRKILHVK